MSVELPSPRGIARTADWVIQEGRYGPCMVLTARWSEAAARAWASRGARELELNYARGWERSDLDFLTGLPDLCALSLTDWVLEDTSVVNQLASLRYLKLFTHCGTELRFDRLPHLEDCALEWRPRAESLFRHSGVRNLFISRLDAGGDCRPFRDMTGLRALALKNVHLSSLDGIEDGPELEFLEIGLARKLSRLEGLEAQTRLTWLELSTCRKIDEVSPVGALEELRVLMLADLGEIASIRPLARLEKLEKLFLIESTDVADGDLSPLLELPRLDHVSFVDRPHYSHRSRDFPELSTEEAAWWRWRAGRELEERLFGATVACDEP